MKYALLYEGDLRPIGELSSLTGVSASVLYKMAKRNELTAERLTAYAKRAALLKRAAELGIGSDLLSFRRKRWGECERVYTEPKSRSKNHERLVLVRGESMTARQASVLTGLSVGRVHARSRDGVPLDAPRYSAESWASGRRSKLKQEGK